MQSLWSARIATLALWGLAAASAVSWGLRFSTAPKAPAAPLAGTALQASGTDAVARLLGAGDAGPARPAVAAAPDAPPPPALASRLVLQGVVAGPEPGALGVAVISLDGRPARPYRVGARIDDGLVLQAVHPRSATIGASRDGPAIVTLHLAERR